MKLILTIAASIVLVSCTTPDLTGLTKDERRIVLEQRAAQQTAWSNAGLHTLQTAENVATRRLERQEGLRK